MVRTIPPLTRRSVILQGVSAIAAGTFAVPADTCDCHTHIFGDPRKFPFFEGRVYTPGVALPDEMARFHRRLHIRRVVIVTPSVYGTDNSATLYGMKARGGSARGVAVIDEKTPEKTLDAMASAGIRGIRLNIATSGQADASSARQRLAEAIRRVESRRWHVQIYCAAQLLPAIKDLVSTSPVPIVFDHFGGIESALGVEQPGFADLIELVRTGRAYVKLSGAYRASKLAPDYADVIPFARALVSANPDRVLWGTDWPHPNTSTGARIPVDDRNLLDQLAVWVPDAQVRKKILVDNAAHLYGF
jgi:predicted TIM-barrel fold metal-dependent hydrolase